MISLLWLLLIISFSLGAEELPLEPVKTIICEETKDSDQDNPYGAFIPCSHLPNEFIICMPLELAGPNHNASEVGICTRFGGQRAEDVLWTNTSCMALDCTIECKGPREFLREVPCIKYTGHYFLSTLLYSVLLGFVAVDRFCLGYSAIAVGKLMTLGGLGVWWIIDIFLLVTGNLTPADDSNWEPYY